MKLALFLIAIFGVACFAFYFIGTGKLDDLVLRWHKEGMDESGAAKVAFHDSYQGLWTLATTGDGDRTLNATLESELLEFDGDGMRRWNLFSGDQPNFTPVYINDAGKIWEKESHTIVGEQIGSLKVEGTLLHFFGSEPNDYRVYERTKPDNAEQGGDTNRLPVESRK